VAYFFGPPCRLKQVRAHKCLKFRWPMSQ